GLERVIVELVEHFMQLTKQGAECLPMVVLVVRVQHHSVRHLTLQMLYDGMRRTIFLCCFFHQIGCGHSILASREAIRGQALSITEFLFGCPLASSEERRVKLGPLHGVPVFGLDALASAAYGPEAALTVLMVLGASGTGYVVPLSGAIIAVLAIVYLSYRQTIAAYPQGGGSYTVAGENLGARIGLVAGAA